MGAAESQKSEVFDLTEDMAARQSEAGGFRAIGGHSDVVFADPPEAEPTPAAAAATAAPQPRLGANEGLLSGSAVAAVDSAFNSLARTVLVENARTLEDLVREMLRPMLKSWLDDNLPGLVERLVRAEIERVSRGRG
jgi:cell pole-organizing protein PopZ